MKWVFAVILFWLSFVVSLASWWLYFGLTTLSTVSETSGIPSQWARHQRMLFMEGSVLILFLVIGGLGLFYLAFRMYKEKSAKEIFFAAFTHDLKTALFRLQLEVERLGKKVDPKSVDPLMNQTRTMQLDLENALDSAVGHNRKIYLEEINVKDFMQDLHAQWPEFHIKFSGDNSLKSDRKALQSVFKNLLHNSYIHGKADEVSLELKNHNQKHFLNYKDNGTEFHGDLESLGKAHNPKSGGSGFGLFIVKEWVRRLGGRLYFSKPDGRSLEISIELPRSVK